MVQEYDVIVIDAEHASIEAGLASARRGAKVLMLTISLDNIAFMPCDPSVGGPAKGIIVHEIDTLGRQMAKTIDKTHIQMRMLNTGRGPAVGALGAQADKVLYQQEMRRMIGDEENLYIMQGVVDELIIEDNKVKGVRINIGTEYLSKAVIITTGTFLCGEIILGNIKYSNGPNHQLPSITLSDSLGELGFDIVRFKTDTPPCINSKATDYSKTEIQPGDDIDCTFSSETVEYMLDQLSCWLTYTNIETHEVIDDNLHPSAMYSRMIKGTGLRYCPSVEDKFVRFNDKPRHQLSLEPEGCNTNEVYVRELSTGLLEHVQRQILETVPSLEKANMMRAGYAIEYDATMPTQLWPTFEAKMIKNLYTAGQINGTSGYEETVGQGLMADINAAGEVLNIGEKILSRSDAYIDVLIDDLVTKGANEPCRLLASRAEYRLLLRHGNADLRLTDTGYELDMISEERYIHFNEKRQQIDAEVKRLSGIRIRPSEHTQVIIKRHGGSRLKDGILAISLLRRPEMTYDIILELLKEKHRLSAGAKEQVEIQTKYGDYINKSLQQVEEVKHVGGKEIPESLDYSKIDSLTTGAREKLSEIKPLGIVQASRVSGVSPADISILLIYLEQGKPQRVNG